MKTRKTIITLFSILLIGVNAIAGALNPSTVPSKADWYFHVNFDQLVQGEIADIMSELEFLVLFETGEESPLRFFTDEEGELSGGITAYGYGADAKASVIRANGINDKEEIVSMFKGSKDYRELKGSGRTIYSWVEKMEHPKAKVNEVEVFAAFIDERTMMASHDKDSLVKALKFLDGDEKGIAAPGNNQAAMLAKANVGAMKADSNIVKMAKTIEAHMNVFADGALAGNVTLETSDKDTADQMSKMIDGMVALSGVYAEPGEWNASENVKVKQSGAKVSIDLSMPVSVLKKIRNLK